VFALTSTSALRGTKTLMSRRVNAAMVFVVGGFCANPKWATVAGLASIHLNFGFEPGIDAAPW
jgi:hypothetical protein